MAAFTCFACSSRVEVASSLPVRSGLVVGYFVIALYSLQLPCTQCNPLEVIGLRLPRSPRRRLRFGDGAWPDSARSLLSLTSQSQPTMSAIAPPSKTKYLTVPETARNKDQLKQFSKEDVAKVRRLSRASRWPSPPLRLQVACAARRLARGSARLLELSRRSSEPWAKLQEADKAEMRGARRRGSRPRCRPGSSVHAPELLARLSLL